MIVMKGDATEQQVAAVIERIERAGELQRGRVALLGLLGHRRPQHPLQRLRDARTPRGRRRLLLARDDLERSVALAGQREGVAPGEHRPRHLADGVGYVGQDPVRGFVTGFGSRAFRWLYAPVDGQVARAMRRFDPIPSSWRKTAP